jgi:hypothetical protein
VTSSTLRRLVRDVCTSRAITPSPFCDASQRTNSHAAPRSSSVPNSVYVVTELVDGLAR